MQPVRMLTDGSTVACTLTDERAIGWRYDDDLRSFLLSQPWQERLRAILHIDTDGVQYAVVPDDWLHAGAIPPIPVRTSIPVEVYHALIRATPEDKPLTTTIARILTLWADAQPRKDKPDG